MQGFKILLLFAVYAITTANYEIGVTNKYVYETTVSVEEECGTDVGAQIVGHRLKAKIHLAAIWENPNNSLQKLLKIQVAEPTLLVPKKSNFEIRSSKLDKATSLPSYFLWESGRVLQWWDDENESQILRNLKKSIATLLQLRHKDQTIKENDVAGNCDVIYKVRGNSIRKKKMNCVNQLYSKRETQPFGVRSLTVQHNSKTDCELKNAGSYVVDKCASSDFVKMFSNVWQRPTVCIRAKSELSSHDVGKEKHVFSDENLDSVLQELKKSFPGTLKEGHISAASAIKEQSSSNNLVESLKKYQDSLKEQNLAKIKSASAFYKLLPIFQNAQKDDIKNVLQNEKLRAIMPQILDLIAASCTRNALSAAFEHFSSSKSSDELLERFLVSLSVLS
ncbi:Microsomal triglyceride transfer protein large subunit, partial [Stegodyphus mimosarum]